MNEPTTYAGDHGGCMSCDSLGHELAERGHRPGCRSIYRNEPPRPKTPGASTYQGFPPVQALVREFHEKFGLPTAGGPTPLKPARHRLRMELIEEELDEYDDAARYGERASLFKVADALADLLYVVYGAALEHGIDMGPVMAEVHRSNMAKLWPDGTVRYSKAGKVMKPPGWAPPDIAGVLTRQGWEP